MFSPSNLDVCNARDKFWHSLKENQKLIGSCLIDIRLLIRALLPHLIVLWSQTLFRICVERRRSLSNFSWRLNAAPPKAPAVSSGKLIHLFSRFIHLGGCSKIILYKDIEWDRDIVNDFLDEVIDYAYCLAMFLLLIYYLFMYFIIYVFLLVNAICFVYLFQPATNPQWKKVH